MKTSKKSKLYYKVDQALDDIRPYLNVDGGDIDLIEVTKDKIVKVKFTGSCATCDVSMMTFRTVSYTHLTLPTTTRVYS